jgi:hypothetical protein
MRWILLVMYDFANCVLLSCAQDQTQESYTTTMKNNLLKLNESSLGIMKRVRKHESKLLSINLPCSINTALERGTP